MQLLEDSPYDFLLNVTTNEWTKFNNFTYRTFQGTDCIYFVQTLKTIYQSGNSLENIFSVGYQKYYSIAGAIAYFRQIFLAYTPAPRTIKHIANVEKGATAKRLNMFLRWMVRSNYRGVDFGLWKSIPSSALMIPLDVHASAAARQLKLLTRKTIDWKAVEEVTKHLQILDPDDPVKYDFALFGLGINHS